MKGPDNPRLRIGDPDCGAVNVHDYSIWRAAVEVAARVAPDLPTALVGMRRFWWGCRRDADRYRRTNRLDPQDRYGAWTAAGLQAHYEEIDENSKSVCAIFASSIVSHHAAGNCFDARMAGEILLEASKRGAALPAEFYALVGRHLTGALPVRRGRSVPFGNLKSGWISRSILEREFAERRAAGEKYDALVAEYSKRLGLSKTTVESIVSPKK